MDEFELAAPKPIVIPYIPRRHLTAFHASKKRHRAMVVHRRGGKTVAIANELLRGALTVNRGYPPGRFGYIGPSFSQAKDTIWNYAKHYSAPISGIKVNEGDLQLTLPNKSLYALYPGGDAYERMRGTYFDMVALDEFPLLNPDAWQSVVRPCLSDYRGRAIIAGTSNGDDHFREMIEYARNNPEFWDVFDIKVSDTDSLHPDEVAEMRQDMGEFKFQREMMNSFDAPIEGAYYGELITQAVEKGRICRVPHDPRAPVITWWDLGIRDLMTIWFVQRSGQSFNVIDYLQGQGKGLDWYAIELAKKGYNYGESVVPHDIMVRELSTGRTRYEIMQSLGLNPFACPSHIVPDRIQAARSVIPLCYFDQDKCGAGVSALKAYKQGNNGKPLHNWASHGADAFGHGAVALDHVNWGGLFGKYQGKIKRVIRGMV